MKFSFRLIQLGINFVLISAIFFLQLAAKSAEKVNPLMALLTGEFDVSLKEDRTEIAEAIYRDLESFKAYIPALNPAQLEWLTNEENSLEKLSGAARTQKRETVWSSEEYKLRSLHDMLAKVLLPLEGIIEKDNLPLRIETASWAWVNLELTNFGFDENISSLSQNGIISLSDEVKEQFGLSSVDENEPWFSYLILARLIQKEIVIPMCMFPLAEVPAK